MKTKRCDNNYGYQFETKILHKKIDVLITKIRILVKLQLGNTFEANVKCK